MKIGLSELLKNNLRLIKDVCIQVDYSNMKFDWILKMKKGSQQE